MVFRALQKIIDSLICLSGAKEFKLQFIFAQI